MHVMADQLCIGAQRFAPLRPKGPLPSPLGVLLEGRDARLTCAAVPVSTLLPVMNSCWSAHTSASSSHRDSVLAAAMLEQSAKRVLGGVVRGGRARFVSVARAQELEAQG